MGKIKNPISFTTYFSIDPAELDAAGAMNPLLNADTKLFINPLLLDSSEHPEVRRHAVKRFHDYLGKLVILLKTTTGEGDPSWRQANRLFDFREIPATCLGYGTGSVSGSGFGPEKKSKCLKTARHIIRLGIEDPEVFLLIPLLEENIGPDLISDMLTKIILQDLAAYTERILKPYDTALDSPLFLPAPPMRNDSNAAKRQRRQPSAAVG